MKKWIILAGVLLISPILSAGLVIDKVIVMVNDDIVTTKELDRAFKPLERQYVQTYQGEELRLKLIEARRQILERIIDQILLYQESRSKGISIKSSEIDEALNTVKVKFPSLAKFKEVLHQQGISTFAFRENIKKQLYVNRYKETFISSRIDVMVSDLKDYYEAHKKAYFEPEEVRASQIFIPFEIDADKEFVRKKTTKIYESLQNGENFEEIARQFSKGANAPQGGDLGFLKNGQMLKEVEDELSRMFIGDISPIIKSSVGFHILKLTARKEPRQMLLSEVEERVRSQVFAGKAKEKYVDILTQLREDAFIEYKSEF